MGNTKRAILCPNCRKLVSADAEVCIHCGMKNPGRLGIHSIFHKLFNSNLGFIQVVIYFCVGIYVISLLIHPSGLFRSRNLLSFLGPDQWSILLLGGTGRYPLQFGRWWTLITAIYLHGSILHILFNLLWLRQLGPMVEGLFGTARLIIIFTVSGLTGFIVSTVMGTQLTIGASGSIFGLLGALVYYGRARGGIFGKIIYPQILTWAIVLFAFGFIAPNIDNFAHLGGFIGGYLTGNFLNYQERKPETLRDRTLAAILIVLTVLAFILNLIVLFF